MGGLERGLAQRITALHLFSTTLYTSRKEKVEGRVIRNFSPSRGIFRREFVNFNGEGITSTSAERFDRDKDGRLSRPGGQWRCRPGSATSWKIAVR